MINFEDRLNQFVTDERGVMWKVVAYCAEPTVTLEKVSLTGEGRERMHIGAASRIADALTLVGEAESKAIMEYHRQLMDRSNRR